MDNRKKIPKKEIEKGLDTLMDVAKAYEREMVDLKLKVISQLIKDKSTNIVEPLSVANAKNLLAEYAGLLTSVDDLRVTIKASEKISDKERSALMVSLNGINQIITDAREFNKTEGGYNRIFLDLVSQNKGHDLVSKLTSLMPKITKPDAMDKQVPQPSKPAVAPTSPAANTKPPISSSAQTMQMMLAQQAMAKQLKVGITPPPVQSKPTTFTPITNQAAYDPDKKESPKMSVETKKLYETERKPGAAKPPGITVKPKF